MIIQFEFDTELGVYKDTLHFSDNEVPSSEVIEAMKQERLTNWLAFVNTASQVSTPEEQAGEMLEEMPEE